MGCTCGLKGSGQTPTDTEVENLIKFVRGIDAYDEAPILPDVSTMNNILAGTSALPVPGGGDLA